MKNILFLALWCSCFACYNCDVLKEIVQDDVEVVALPESVKDKLIILHLDINGVLIGVDSTHQGGAHDYMIYQLSKLIVDDWGEGEMRYFDWVNRRVAEGEHREDTTRLLRSKIEGREYAPLYDRVFDLLVKESEQEAVFPAFYRLLEALEGFNYRICLRTFGRDAEEVAGQIGLDFFRVTSHGDVWECEDGRIISEIAEMHALCKSSHLLVQDCYSYWSKRGRLSEAGKIFPICDDDQVVEFFFDDNVIKGVDPRVSVVNPRRFDGSKVNYLNEMGKSIVDVKTAQVIGNKNYFVSKISELELKKENEEKSKE